MRSLFSVEYNYLGAFLMDGPAKQILIVSIVTVTIILMLILARSEKSVTEGGVEEYQYSKFVRWLFSIIVPLGVILDIGVIYESFEKGHTEDLFRMGFIVFNVMLVAFLFAWIYFFKTRVKLTNKYLIKSTPFWTKTFPLNKISKILIYYGAGNEAASMMRLYCGKQRITIEAFIVGYQDLVWDLENRCENAVVIEKGK